MIIRLHCLGFVLSSRFYDKNYLEEMAPGGVHRKAPNLDKEVMVGVMESFFEDRGKWRRGASST